MILLDTTHIIIMITGFRSYRHIRGIIRREGGGSGFKQQPTMIMSDHEEEEEGVSKKSKT